MNKVLGYYIRREKCHSVTFSRFTFQLSDLQMTVEGLEKERDFYFGKLRDIEVLCQEYEHEDSPLVKSIMDILYATEVG